MVVGVQLGLSQRSSGGVFGVERFWRLELELFFGELRQKMLGARQPSRFMEIFCLWSATTTSDIRHRFLFYVKRGYDVGCEEEKA